MLIEPLNEAQIAEMRALREHRAFLNTRGVERLRALEIRDSQDPDREDALAGKIDSVWLVLRPSVESVVEDILVECTPAQLALQFAGGLDPAGIVAMFAPAQHAMAEQLAYAELRLVRRAR